MPNLPNRDLTKSYVQFHKAVRWLSPAVLSACRYQDGECTIHGSQGKAGRTGLIGGNPCIGASHRDSDHRVDAAAMRGLQVGGVFSWLNEPELNVAKTMPANELMHFPTSGTEAVLAALPLTHSYSGREGSLSVEGGHQLRLVWPRSGAGLGQKLTNAGAAGRSGYRADAGSAGCAIADLRHCRRGRQRFSRRLPPPMFRNLPR